MCILFLNSIVIYLLDKGVKLLDESNPLYNKMLRVIEKSDTVIAAEESINEYGIILPEDTKIALESILSVTADITYLEHMMTLE